MSVEKRQGLFAMPNLKEDELRAAKDLVDICYEYDHLQIPLQWEKRQSQTNEPGLNVLYYEHDRLLGYLTLEQSEPDSKELLAFVHPTSRRKGIFRRILNAVREVYPSPERLILLCESQSQSGQGCLQALGAGKVCSEYYMRLTEICSRKGFDDRLTIRPVDSSDLDILVQIQATNFAVEPVLVDKRISQLLMKSWCHYYLANFGDPDVGCQEPVASFRLENQGDSIGIYAFGVLPEYRGRGYGRQILEEIIFFLQGSHRWADRSIPPLHLFVTTTNQPALELYRSCGFSIVTTLDYFDLSL